MDFLISPQYLDLCIQFCLFFTIITVYVMFLVKKCNQVTCSFTTSPRPNIGRCVLFRWHVFIFNKYMVITNKGGLYSK